MAISDPTALRLGPGNWRTPLVPPLVTVAFVLLALASMVHSAWSLLEPAFLADPRPEVRGFVNAVRVGAATEGDRAALAAFRATLSPRGKESLGHEINYLLSRDGRVQRFGFDTSGRVIELPPESVCLPFKPTSSVCVIPGQTPPATDPATADVPVKSSSKKGG